ncbi:exonuclease 1 isoform X1 [Crotalus tigris]|uniref:exonuclease 1 isoform X1 n=1 Tax=Crotalus tigris TaxID=88082 RepID=UPI00192F12DF|nr:exonuclease 1 isoform X1 [Crotalus tigris]
MGIQGLLQFIKEAAEPTHVKKYKGQVIAVDTYCWLHKGAYACAEKLAKGEATDQYVVYCMKLVDMLLSFGVKPILVFDGCTLPSKKEVEKTRREKRQANLLKGKQLLREGKLSEARECFSRSINVTHAMAHEVIKAARAQGIDCLVAPYEADAQLAYLNKTGMVQAIITEDSDLLTFGCKKVFLKIDKFGNGLEIDQARLGMCKQLGDVFTEEKFRYMCILSGCDYLPSIHGIGLGKSCKLLKIANNPDIIKVIGKMGHYLKMNILVSEEYIQGFIRANNTFLYQLVFDPVRRKLVPLNAYEDDVDPETLEYAGKYLDDRTAFQIALGNKDIITMEQIDDYDPDVSPPVQRRSHSSYTHEKSSYLKSIWNKDYNPCFTTKIVTNSTPLLEKPTTRGIERLINLKGLKLPSKMLVAKRPRHEEASEEELLSQYFSNSKKTKTEKCDESQQLFDGTSAVCTSQDSCKNKDKSCVQPRLRNKFATILQKENEKNGTVVVPGTRSRFFCNIGDLPETISKNKTDQPLQDNEADSSTKKINTLTEDHSPCSSETGEIERNFSTPVVGQSSCFTWSRSFAEKPATPSLSETIALLKQFQRHSKDTDKDCSVTGTQITSPANKNSDEETSPLKDLQGSSKQNLDKLLQSKVDTSEKSPVAEKNAIPAKESNRSPEPDDLLNSQILPSSQFIDNKNTVSKNMIPALCRTNSLKSSMVAKCKLLVPAKVSGLSKKITSIKKKHHDAENKSGLQVKINDLWKSFQFKRESEILPSCRKSEPLSPIKDSNNQLLPDICDETFDKCNGKYFSEVVLQI